MKRLLLLALVCQIFAFNSFSQEPTRDGLISDLDTYEELFSSGQFDSLLYYVNPKLFDIVPKEIFVDAISSIFEPEEGLKVEINEFTTTYIMDVKEIDSRMFSLIEYNLKMKMTYLEGFGDQEDAEMMKSLLIMSYGKDNVDIDEEEGSVSLSVPSSMFAEYIEDRWTFTRYDTSQQGMLDQILGKDIQKEILKTRYSEEPVSE